MEHVAPLLQTILWVALIGGIVWRFNKPLHGLLTALQSRIDQGSNIKVGPFEISQAVRPQPVEQQVKRTEAEVTEVIQAQDEESDTEANSQPREAVKSRFLEAEDLALRAIQVQYGKPISRQLSLGPDFGVDGAFTVDGALNIVEVKYLVRPSRGYESIRRTLQSFQQLFADNHWRRVTVILAVVLQYPSDMEKTKSDLSAIAAQFDFQVAVHCYSVSELRAQFGLADG